MLTMLSTTIVVMVLMIPYKELYKVKFTVQVRSFVGQKSGRMVGNHIVAASTLSSFKTNLWTLAKSYVKREVVIDETEENFSFVNLNQLKMICPSLFNFMISKIRGTFISIA